MDCPNAQEAVDAAIRLAMDRPQWRLTLQAHKLVGLK
jgi:organic radical activating enzyme